MFSRHPASTLCFITIAFIACCAFSVHAQSGRRQPKPVDAAPVPTPTPEPTPVPKKREEDTKVIFIVGMDRSGGVLNYPLAFYDIVQNECAERLRQGTSGIVDVGYDSMNRAEAYKKAKLETTANVVWLQLTADAMSNTQNYDSMEIEFVVFAPGTGKTLTSGRGYQNTSRKGPVVIGPPAGSSNMIYRQELLKRAAQDVADRILDALHMTVTAPIPNFRE